ncbi:hypothetical protein ACWDA9_17885 [Streptomyces sp. NPDC001193]
MRALGNGRYQARTCDGRLQEARGAAEGVALVVAELPADVPAPLWVFPRPDRADAPYGGGHFARPEPNARPHPV